MLIDAPVLFPTMPPASTMLSLPPALARDYPRHPPSNKRQASPATASIPKRPRPSAPASNPIPTGPGPPACLASARTSAPAPAPPDLPDQVLVCIFRFMPRASRLAQLRTVCRQWRRVIDSTPSVWRAVSFKNALFDQPVVACLRTRRLGLGRRVGERAVRIAARSGNEWACFLRDVLFDRRPLYAVTTPQPGASQLVMGKRSHEARPFPPWLGPRRDGAWIAVHAARRGADEDDVLSQHDRKLPRGALVGMIHVTDAVRAAAGWVWRIDRAVQLNRPIRCAGFMGLWTISPFLTELLVSNMHSQ